jgi:hypothetical protein
VDGRAFGSLLVVAAALVLARTGATASSPAAPEA